MRILRTSILVLLPWVVSCGSTRSWSTREPPPPLPVAGPALAPGEIGVTWLGVGGVLLRGRNVTVAVDPYVTRSNPVAVALGHLQANPRVVDRYVPKVDVVLVSESHYDHLQDVPYVVRRDGAELVGTLTTSMIAQSYGVPDERIHVVGGGDLLNLRGVLVDVMESRHAPGPLGTPVMPGVVERRQDAPLHATAFKAGGSLFYRVVVDGVAVGYGAAVRHPGLTDLDVDLLVMPTAVDRPQEDTRTVLLASRPSVVMPVHFDLWLAGLSKEPWVLPGGGVERIQRAVAEHLPGSARVVRPQPLREMVFNARTGLVH